jgi:PAS domain S-box-containing protein
VSGEIVLEKLIDTLMRTAIEHAGAERGLLILPRGVEQRIEAEATTSGDTVIVRLREASVAATALPESIVHYVVRTQESVILDDAAAQNPFSADAYIRQRHARSILCLPLINQAKLIGVLYLENSLTPHAFTPTRIAVLKLLASQAAISLENTRLYRDLEEREAKIRRLVDANIIGILVSDLEGQITEANDAFLDMVGYSRDDLVSGRMRWTELTPAEWRAVSQREVAQLRATGSIQPFEKEYFRKNGSRVPVLVGAAAFEGGRSQSVAFVLDLTERKQAEARQKLLFDERKRAEYLTGQMFESSPDVVCIIGRDYRYQRVNPTYGRNSGMPAERIVGMHIADLFGMEVFEQTIKPKVDRCLAGEEVSYAEWFNYARGRRYVAVTYSPLRPDAERVEAVLAIGRDLTEHVLASEALRDAQADLAHANRVTTLGQLSASIAHEVSQPISAVATNAHAALRWLGAQPPDLEEVRQALGRIVKDGNRAADVFGRIRGLIKKAPPRKDGLEINETILEVIALTRGEAVKNGVSVQTQLAEGLPLIQGDRVQLQQVILNLIMNAVEAMSGVSEGSRELLISTGKTEPDGVLVAVRDSGPGLAPASLGRLFDAFYTTKPGGLGMGLSICRSIVEAHGGRLWAAGNVLQGAIFQFTLPAHPDSAS